jgi:hypothetical protein
MQENAPRPPPDADPTERRRLARKLVLLTGLIADTEGEKASPCTVHDIHTGGAQIGGVKNLSIGTRVYFIDTGNRVAYLANVAWIRADRIGLAFLHKYAIGFALSPDLMFLWRLLLEAKLTEIERSISKGTPVALAFLNADLSEVHLHQMARCAKGDVKFEHTVKRARSMLNG